MSQPRSDTWSQELRDADSARRCEAARQLAAMDPVPAATTLALVDAASDADEEVREWANEALERLAQPDPAAVADLCRRLEQAPAASAYWAATALGRLGHAAGAAVASLRRALDHHAAIAVRERSAWALGRLGPIARDALPSLRQAAQGGTARLARLAQASIAQIGGGDSRPDAAPGDAS